MKFASWLARQKYRFDTGQTCLAILNFAFIIIAASDKISTLTGWPAKLTVIVFVPCAMVLVWTMGFILDKTKFIKAYQDEHNRHNKMLNDIHSK